MLVSRAEELSGARMRIECASRTHVGLKRKINEDSIFVASERGLWAVADGMGGHEAGEVASAMVVDALAGLAAADDLDDLTGRVQDALAEANRRLVEMARASASKQSIGTTVVGLAIADGAFRCFWMGDSRAYRLRAGEIARVSRDHSLVQRLVDAGMLKPEDAETHEHANVVTRAVGVSEEVDVEVVSGDVEAGDQFLLASDGLTRVVRDEEIAAELQHALPEEAADNLLRLVLERGAPDNVSIIIIRVPSS
jgi:serine/threonine-protein phosphatase Stp1